VQPAAPSTFSTPALGSELVILDEDAKPSDEGEVFLVPPSMGLSRQLLNGDHHAVYYADVPRTDDGRLLRRHGDRMQRYANGYFRAHGRADDSMNLGGIKVSSLQIEEVVGSVDGIRETAAIAVPPKEGGPDRLVVYAVSAEGSERSPRELLTAMQHALRTQLNPLFKLHEVVVTPSLPRTASNKIMRRELRAAYQQRAE
jgi:acetyl-CoA synthetase